MSWLRRLGGKGRHRLQPGGEGVDEVLAKLWFERVHATPEDPTLLRAAPTMLLPLLEFGPKEV